MDMAWHSPGHKLCGTLGLDAVDVKGDGKDGPQQLQVGGKLIQAGDAGNRILKSKV